MGVRGRDADRVAGQVSDRPPPRRRRGSVVSQPEGTPPQAVWHTYIWVEDADEAAATARRVGGSVVSEPFEVMDAGRTAVLADPEGAVFSVWQAREHRGAGIVNEPGSLNFNVLNTRNAAAVKGFYGAVFGWTERTARMGAAGFEDVVAAIARSPRMTPTRPPTGASRSRPTTPMRRRRRRPTSAARCSSLRSRHRTPA
jgi:predicted enzyme related to lactoylglutathione lyase